MGKQFEDVGGRYGAPMGRRSYGTVGYEFAPRSVRLFRVNLDGGGYDDGGAYWGIGEPLYCATDDIGYREFIRAGCRFDAAALLQIDPEWLARPVTLDGRYSVQLELCGYSTPRWVTRYRGEWLEANGDKNGAIFAALEHRCETIGQ